MIRKENVYFKGGKELLSENDLHCFRDDLEKIEVVAMRRCRFFAFLKRRRCGLVVGAGNFPRVWET